MEKTQLKAKSSKDVFTRKRKAEWHPFGNAIILISIIVAILLAFWFVS